MIGARVVRRPLASALLVALAALAALGLATPVHAVVAEAGDHHSPQVISELAHPTPTLRGRQLAHAVPIRGYLAVGPVLLALLPPAEPVPALLIPLGFAPQDGFSPAVAAPVTPVGSRAPPTVL